MEQILKQQPQVYQTYKDFMQEYLYLGHMNEVKENGNDHKAFYLPHHPIIKEKSSTTKLRVVFNDSSKTTTGYSSTDVLHTGPKLRRDIFPLLLRFRSHPIAISADITKMYRQILVHPEDTPYQRIIWRDESGQGLKEYELKPLTYGTSCAPFLAIRVLKQLAHDEQIRFPTAEAILKSDFYVDDLLTGCETVENGRKLIRELDQLLQAGGFKLRQWTSNKPTVLDKLQETDKSTFYDNVDSHMNEVKENGNDHKAFYLPHHPIIKEKSSTTKLRVVFNDSSKTTTGYSSTDVLHTGPKLRRDIFPLLLRFRSHPIAISADITKMYRQILVHPEDTPYQRIIWRDESGQGLKEYELKPLTYGTSCAPFLAIRVLKQLAHDEQIRFPTAEAILKSDFYVDDLLTGCETVENGRKLIRELDQLLQAGGFKLRQWTSNKPTVLDKLQETDKSTFYDNVDTIHIEIVTNSTTEAFLAALRRFIARRGRPAEINTDNATNFVGAYKDLRKLFNSNIHDFASSEEIKWNFIPPYSPHFRGLWEARIKSVKYNLRRIVGKTELTFEELTTVLTQIEACLNLRPLCPLTDDPEDLTALTAGHFLIGMPPTAVPSLVRESGSSLKRKCKLVEQIKTDFWKRWSCEYFSRLQNRPKWLKPVDNIKIGTLVLLKEDNLPPLNWRMGRINQVYQGEDGVVRVVSVKTADGDLRRSVAK
ncbi:hypothetical protein LAZ67_17000006, partial [Cordylochernes scorpioides]